MWFLSIAFNLYLHVLLTGAAVLERQVSVGPLSPSSTSSSPTLTRTVVITSTLPPTIPTVTRFILTYTRSGSVSLSTATFTARPAVSTSTFRLSTFSFPSATQLADGRSSNSKGAIAGGVLGALAVILAVSAAFIWFRRRSPRHWRNRTASRWQMLDGKSAASGAGVQHVYVGELIYSTHAVKASAPRPLAPLYIRDPQSAANPFTDISTSPTTSPRHHTRSGSSTSVKHGRESPGAFDIELKSTNSQKC